MNLASIKYITIYVSDLTRSIGFYRDGLGLKVTYKDETFVQFDTNGIILALEVGGSHSESPKDFRRNGLGVQFEVEDIDRMVGHLKSRRVRFSQEITEVDFGRVATLIDPDGNQLQLLEQ